MRLANGHATSRVPIAVQAKYPLPDDRQDYTGALIKVRAAQ